MKYESVFSCLKDVQKSFDEDYLQAKRYVMEHLDELSDRFSYASFLEQPLQKNQILFWGGTWNNFIESAAGKLFSLLHNDQGKKYSCIFVSPNAKEFSKMNKMSIPTVQKNTEEYRKMLACSEYLVGTGILPSSFVKRKDQICALFPGNDEKTGADRYSLLLKDYLKADFLFVSDKEEFLRVFPLVDEYSINIFDINKHFETDEILKILIGPQTEEPEQQHRNKKLLLLCNWKDGLENRRLIRFLAQKYTNDGYNVTAASLRIADTVLEEEFDQLNASVRFIFRGKMTVTVDEFLLFHILENHPQLYIREPAIREFLDILIKREFRRLWGNEKQFDKTVLAGDVNPYLFFLTAGSSSEKKILADSNFLKALFEKDACGWRDCRGLFDEYLLLPDEYELKRNRQEHTPKNKLICPRPELTVSKEILQLCGEEYLICDEWMDVFGKIQTKLLRYPSENSILVNGELLPDKLRIKKIRELLAANKGDLFVIGKQAGSYAEDFPHAVLLGNYVKRWLPFLPGASLFFSQFSIYFDDDRLEYDVMRTILQSYSNIRSGR